MISIVAKIPVKEEKLNEAIEAFKAINRGGGQRRRNPFLYFECFQKRPLYLSHPGALQG